MSRRRLRSRCRHEVALLLMAALLTGCSEPVPVATTAAPEATSPPQPGRILSTGANDSGQLGRPAPTGLGESFGAVARSSSEPLTGVVGAAGGGRHSLALMSDGTVLAWGANDVGQLGDGTSDATSVPVQVLAPDGRPGHLQDVEQVAADSDFSMALLRDGTVVTWGQGNRAQRGNGAERADQLTPSSVLDVDGQGLLDEVVQIAADGNTEVARLRDGTLVGWGDSSAGQLGSQAAQRQSLPVAIVGPDGRPLSDIVDIGVGGQHVLALRADGTVLAWGGNELRQLGDGTTTPRNAPVTVLRPDGRAPLHDVVAVDAAEKHNVARLEDGTVVAWGNNSGGQLGVGDFGEKRLPVFVQEPDRMTPLGDVRTVQVGEAYTTAVLHDGSLLMWGAGRRGQLGDGGRQSRPRPGPVTVEDDVTPEITAIGTGERHLLIVLK